MFVEITPEDHEAECGSTNTWSLGHGRRVCNSCRQVIVSTPIPIEAARREAAERNARMFGTDPSWYGQ